MHNAGVIGLGLIAAGLRHAGWNPRAKYLT